MGKRSEFKRRKNDTYFTPEKAVLPLIPHLPQGHFTFIEPCAGDGRLIRYLTKHTKGRCAAAYDIDPMDPAILQRNAMSLTERDVEGVDFFITNPPWTRDLLHPLIEHLSGLRPTWLLFDADWLFTKQAAPYLPYLSKVVTIGRVRWIEGSKMDGKDNSMWCHFYRNNDHRTKFFGRENHAEIQRVG